MNIVKLTDKIWNYQNLDLDTNFIINELNDENRSSNWFDYTNGFLLDGTEYEATVKGEAICVFPDSKVFKEIFNVIKQCVENYLELNNDPIDIGNLDINPIDSKGNTRSTHVMIRKYLPGTTMTPHHDAILSNGGGYTILLYLNDDYEGGELNFNDENFSVKPPASSILIFPERTMHEILFLKSGKRYMTAAYIFKKYPSEVAGV